MALTPWIQSNSIGWRSLYDRKEPWVIQSVKLNQHKAISCSQMRICDFANMPKSYEKPGNLKDFRAFTGTPKGTRSIMVSLRRAVASDAHPRHIQFFESLLKKITNPNPSPTGKKFGFVLFGTPKGTRTPDLLIRSQSLYPTELSAHNASLNALRYNSTVFWKMQVLFCFF